MRRFLITPLAFEKTPEAKPKLAWVLAVPAKFAIFACMVPVLRLRAVFLQLLFPVSPRLWGQGHALRCLGIARTSILGIRAANYFCCKLASDLTRYCARLCRRWRLDTAILRLFSAGSFSLFCHEIYFTSGGTGDIHRRLDARARSANSRWNSASAALLAWLHLLGTVGLGGVVRSTRLAHAGLPCHRAALCRFNVISRSKFCYHFSPR